MKKVLLLLILTSGLFFGQKKEILIGALSEMDINYDLANEKFYKTDVNKSSEEIKLIWKDYKLVEKLDGLRFYNDYVSIEYNFKNNIVIKKTLSFEQFSNFQFLLNNFYKNTKPSFQTDGTFNKYSFNENGSDVLFSTSFFTYGDGIDNFNNDYIFSINFTKR